MLKINFMKRIILLFAFLPLLVQAQDKNLVVLGSTPQLYLNHTVVAKDNFYSIGRMYNVSPKEIVPFNKITLEKALVPGAVLKIPLVASNFSQNNSVGETEVLLPLYYTVKDGEGLYRVSASHNKVPLETLKKWNKLSTDVVPKGARLIIGYLKVVKELSPLAGEINPVQNVVKETPVKPLQPEKKPEQVPVVETKAPVKVVPQEPIPEIKKPTPPPVVLKDTFISTPPVEIIKPKAGPGISFNGGYFKTLFENQSASKELTKDFGTAGIFKSSSGWKDGKYYCLHNTQPAGTIVMVTNIANGKVIYAKVLDLIPDIKLNAGLAICISNAAAEELGSGENNFTCTIQYVK